MPVKCFDSLKLATLIVTALTGVLAQVPALADTIAVIGTGNVGAALGRRFAENGHEIVYGSRNPQRADVITLVTQTGHGATAASPAQAARDAEIVVFAVPWEAVVEVADSLGDLSGKIDRIERLRNNAKRTQFQ